MSISAAQVKELRDKTGAGMMDCKTALNETNGDMEAAIDWLRAKGIAKADKKAGRTAAEGLIGVNSDAGKGVVVEVNSETDFVARNDAFQDIVRNIAQVALTTDGSVEALAASTYPGSTKTVLDTIKDAIGTIGENMNLRRSAMLTVEAGAVATYIHNAVTDGLGKLGVLVAVETTGDAEAARAFGRQVAMHVAATNPMALTAEQVDATAVAREKAIFTEQARGSGKPDAIIEKMVEGRLRKFYEEVVLLKQAFVINPDLTVEAALKAAEKDIGAPAKITGFVRFALGEGIEKEETDFAAEVAAAVKK
ncbi:translation elongation factor Ts [Aquibium sp. ELW1220]|jgi:elongation factor Ts|uniref:translation elongation factor Ts n=1 Tax=Aquibium sp. ELW1220 TaxID=2976766 RepID=UPI0025B1B7E6|nr:translation elongation factor Ts [Aquibium sp. ELW1220]MDN2581545.1 translation elongation factor Ts [Aquibium sp. ELW1220]